MRIFLDANILFSAAKSDGGIRKLVFTLIGKGHDCVIDAFVLEEARRNLGIKYLHGLPALHDITKSLHFSQSMHSIKKDAAGLPIPETDKYVLSSAIHTRCNFLVTGDRRHFGAFYGKTVCGMVIHSPQSIAAVLL